MPYANGNKNESLKVLSIGIILIVAVVGIIFLKSKFGENEKKEIIENSPRSENELSQKAAAISEEDLNKQIMSGADILVIDIRNLEEFAIEHIIDSKNIPLENLSENIISLEKHLSYIIVDNSGNIDSIKQAVGILSAAEISNIYYLEGGFYAWKSSFNQTISAGNPTSFSDRAKVSPINSDEFKKIIDTEKNLYIIDVRKSGAYQEGHIANAKNIFLEDIENRRKEIPLGKKIIVYDNDGFWSFQAAVRLFDLGVINVFSLSDGLNAWKQKGYGVTKEITAKP